MSAILGMNLDKDCLEKMRRGTGHLQPTRGDKKVGISFLTAGKIINEKGDDGETIDQVLAKILGKESGQEIRNAQAAISGVDFIDRQALTIEDSDFGTFSVVGDLALVNRGELKKEYPYLVGSDLRVCAGLIAGGKDPVDGLEIVLNKARGRFNLGVISANGIFACKDPYGFRSLALVRNENGCCGFSSESAALGAAFGDDKMTIIREARPAEIVEIKSTGYETKKQLQQLGPLMCIFDLVYGQEPGSIFDDISIWLARFLVGQLLATDFPTNTEIIFSFPLSAISAAQGFAYKSKIPLVDLWQLNPKGRSYLPGDERERKRRGSEKYTPIQEALRQFKSYTAVDDSIVEANQFMTRLMLLIRLIKNIHKLDSKDKPDIYGRIASPPKVNFCPLERPIRPESKLFAATRSKEQMREELGFRTLEFAPMDGDKFAQANLDAQSEYRKATYPITKKNFCLCCFEKGCDMTKALFGY